ncbi:hypothetical protein SAMN05192529_104132 [Arachidicoccus rhizosphaerae]|uniref:BNR repeat-like domain-containing protein n=1 Tax=Arachidicoccus rhizosphaerae TaxID=551991 RepID=A0A1H3X2T8_9BACT|nr:six-hairpin glycosidase [Arachidicoccus rhizosphaerae]SDZ92954.1 hypothetical protein SAMN05192529_104132 [Arachidicoccus rhizosphaerae]
MNKKSLLRDCLIILAGLTGLAASKAEAQDTVHYSGKQQVNVDYHDGRLPMAVGVHNQQIFRANRQHPQLAEGYGWTYNHQPMMAYWNQQFYVEYLSDKVGESVPPGQTLLLTSKNGQDWTQPKVVFPIYRIPDGTTKPGVDGVAKNLDAVMHQRMGFYVTKSGRLFILGFYGIVLHAHDDPNDGKGIGRVIREIYKDGSWGPIYFIHYNPGWTTKNTAYPFYTESKDKGFVEGCNELMGNPLMMMQWEEETDRNDSLIPLKKNYKAFNFYHLPDGRVVGLWKYALTAISKDDGHSWPVSALRAPGFVNSNAKIWGQRTSDGKYATVYNPSEFRWPLAISTSSDGLNYTNLLLVNGEIAPMRYGGAYKSYGPQYTRGIIEGNGQVPDKNLWVTYSMNKEDIWVADIPVPVTSTVKNQADDDFNALPDGQELRWWNYYSPLMAPVRITKMKNGRKALTLKDKDHFDYAKATRLIPPARSLVTEINLMAAQNNLGHLDIEFQDSVGTAAIRLSLDSLGSFYTKAGYRNKEIMHYDADKLYHIEVSLNTDNRFYTVNVNGQEKMRNLFFAPVHEISRVVFRTGGVRRFPDADTPTDPVDDLPDAGKTDPEATYFITSFRTTAH